MIIETAAALKLIDKYFKKSGIMKENKKELDVDFIGGLGPLTKEEEKIISEFIKASKERSQKQKARQKTRTANKSIVASGAGL